MFEERALRRLRTGYRRHGITVRKIPTHSRWYVQYGPYMLVSTSTTGILASNLTLEELQEDMAGR